MRILVVEDEYDLADALAAMLEMNQYVVDVASDGEEALYFMEASQYNAIILDIMMPKLDGYQVIDKMRQMNNHTPVLMLTAKNQLEDKVQGLDLGADDYLTKPFEALELLARLRSLLRRPTSYTPDLLTVANVTLDRNAFRLSVGSESVELNNKEFRLLELLLLNSTQVLSTEMILERIWGLDSDVEINVVWVNISSLRKKLQKLEASIKIASVRGLGYKIEEIV